MLRISVFKNKVLFFNAFAEEDHADAIQVESDRHVFVAFDLLPSVFHGLVVVDAFEGAMPQTKFVLMKALDLDLPVIVCINKIDRPEARPEEVIDEVLELFMDLDASDEQLDAPFVFASAKEGYAITDLADEKKDMSPLFELF